MPLPEQNHVFLDPENCGSGVGYYITVNEYTPERTQITEYSIQAKVILSDCTHKIDWDFGEGTDEGKIDAAILMLQEFRKRLLDTKKLITKLKTGKK